MGYIVDHIEELTPANITDPNIALNHDNLQYLCLDCHNSKTFGAGLPTEKGLRFDFDRIIDDCIEAAKDPEIQLDFRRWLRTERRKQWAKKIAEGDGSYDAAILPKRRIRRAELG
jgi:hypothetical protein